MRGLGHGNGELATNNTRKVLFRFDFAFPYCSSLVGHSWVFISFSLIAYIWRFVVEFPISNFVFLCWWVGISLSKQNSFGYRLHFPPMEIGIGKKTSKRSGAPRCECEIFACKIKALLKLKNFSNMCFLLLSFHILLLHYIVCVQLRGYFYCFISVWHYALGA